MSTRRDRIRDKVMSRVEIVQGTVLETPCHIWTGPTSGSKGRGKDYPRMCLDGGSNTVRSLRASNSIIAAALADA